jgi:hypothetical protein
MVDEISWEHDQNQNLATLALVPIDESIRRRDKPATGAPASRRHLSIFLRFETPPSSAAIDGCDRAV